MKILKYQTILFLIIFATLAISCEDDKPAIKSALIVFIDAYLDTVKFDSSFDKNLRIPLLEAIKKEGKDLNFLKVIVYPLHGKTAQAIPVAEIDIDETLLESIRGTNIVGRNKYNKLWDDNINKKKAGIPDETSSCRIFKSIIPLGKQFTELSDEYEKINVLYISDMIELDVREEENGRYRFLEDNENIISSSSIEMAKRHMKEDQHELNKMLEEFRKKCPKVPDKLHVFIFKPSEMNIRPNKEGKGTELIDDFWEEFFGEGLGVTNFKVVSKFPSLLNMK